MKLLLLALGSISQPAMAQSTNANTDASADRPFDIEVGLRYRSLSMPNSLLDIWFTNASDSQWVRSGEDRPDIKAMSIGVEYILKWDMSNTILYFDYLSSRTPGGYWDDRDEAWSDGSIVVPTDNLAIINMGANYMADIKLVKLEQTEGNFGLDLMLGGGLGIGFVTGEVQYWEQGPESGGLHAYEMYECHVASQAGGTLLPNCQGRTFDPTLQKIPRVLPMIDIIAALRFNIKDKTAIRIEGGLHDLLYMGIGVDVIL